MKFNRNVDSISNLEAVVIYDLRNIGVKIPKIRKQPEQQNHSVVSVSIAWGQQPRTQRAIMRVRVKCIWCVDVE